MSLPSPPPYQPDHFVNRRDEIDLVVETLHDVSRGDTERPRTIVFRGERGLGKSWLAFHLKREELKPTGEFSDLTTLLIGLAHKPDDAPSRAADNKTEWHISAADAEIIRPGMRESSESFEPIVRDILLWFVDALEIKRTSNAPLRDISAWLAQDIERWLKKEPERLLCLIVDSVFDADWGFLDAFERYLLGALAALPRVVIIITGRGRNYQWNSPYLRAEREPRDLVPFVEEQVIDQIDRELRAASATRDLYRSLSALQRQRMAREIISLGGGYPLTNYLLAAAILQRMQEDGAAGVMSVAERFEAALSHARKNTALLENVAKRLLEVIPEKEWQELRPVFEALCVLQDGFREGEIAPLLAARKDEPPSGRQYELTAIREWRDRLVATNLVGWKDKRYVMDGAVRAILESSLEARNDKTWLRLHRSAATLFTEWSQKYRSAQAYYAQRAQYHQEKIQNAQS